MTEKGYGANPRPGAKDPAQLRDNILASSDGLSPHSIFQYLNQLILEQSLKSSQDFIVLSSKHDKIPFRSNECIISEVCIGESAYMVAFRNIVQLMLFRDDIAKKYPDSIVKFDPHLNGLRYQIESSTSFRRANTILDPDYFICFDIRKGDHTLSLFFRKNHFDAELTTEVFSLHKAVVEDLIRRHNMSTLVNSENIYSPFLDNSDS